MSRPYKIPKNLCQLCYEVNARYIMDCYCILCEECFHLKPPKNNQCSLCNKITKGHKIDAKQESSMKRVGYMFENLDAELTKLVEVYKFQNEVANRYCFHLEHEIMCYRKAVSELISINPSLHSFFSSRIKQKKIQQNERSLSVASRQQPTIKPQKEYASEIYQSHRSTIIHDNSRIERDRQREREREREREVDMQGIRPIARGDKTHSGNVVYKVPNLNYNTAVRSSRKINSEYGYAQDSADNYGYRRN